MRTHDFMDMLAHEPQPPRDRGLKFYFLLALAVLIVEAVLFLFLGFGMREDYFDAIIRFPVMAKQLTALYMLLALLPILPLYFYPETTKKNFVLRIAAFVVAMGALWLFGLAQLGGADLSDAIMGSTNLRCLVMVSAMALPVTFILLLGYRDGATTRPALTGFLIGLGAGAAGAFLYAFVCSEDNPLFYAIWYSLAIFTPALVGAVLGRIMLRF